MEYENLRRKQRECQIKKNLCKTQLEHEYLLHVSKKMYKRKYGTSIYSIYHGIYESQKSVE